MSLFRTVLLLSFVACATACDKVPLLAPTQSTITLTVSTTVVPVNGTATLTASVTEAAGTPVQNGTVVTFTSSFGTLDPAEARTEGGKATARFVASAQSGTARLGAFSGATRATELELLVGGAAATRVQVRADPTSVPANGGSTQVIATVLDASGNPLAGVTVTFTTTAGQVSPGQAITGANGEARTTLTAPRTATVTASAGAQDGTVIVNAQSPGVTIAAPTTAIEAGVAATFTITPNTGDGANGIRSVVINFGDGTADVNLGSVNGSTTVTHAYARTGQYIITARVTDTQGIEGPPNSIGISVIQGILSVTLSGTPIPVSVSSALQQGLVTFAATSGGFGSTTAGATYYWTFGDNSAGAQTTGAGTSHRYTAAGNYIARVEVISATGQTGFAEIAIRVNP